MNEFDNRHDDRVMLEKLATRCWRWGQIGDSPEEWCDLPANHLGPCVVQGKATLPVYR